MKKEEFEKRVTLAKMKGAQVEACRLVLVDGLTAYSAAQKTGMSEGNLSRSLRKVQREVCECCGQFKPE